MRSGGANSAYCAKFASCTAAVAANEGKNISTTQVYNMWIDLNKAPGWTLGRTLLAAPAINGGNVATQLSAIEFISSLGRGNYNAGFMSFTAKTGTGSRRAPTSPGAARWAPGSVVQASSSITVPDPYNFKTFGTYGTQPFDVKFVYSLLMLYQVPYFHTQHGLVGRALGGWSIAPLFTWRSGLPLRVNVGSNAQAFGEIYGGSNSANYEEAAGAAPFTGGSAANYNVTSSGSAGASGNPAKGARASTSSPTPKPSTTSSAGPSSVSTPTRAARACCAASDSGTWMPPSPKTIRATERFGATLPLPDHECAESLPASRSRDHQSKSRQPQHFWSNHESVYDS